MRKNHLLRKRIFSIIMTLIMVVSMMPANVWAVNDNVAEVTVNGTTTQYTDIDAAFAAAQEASSATVKLLANVTISHANDTYGIQLEKGNITLDLNGKTISQKSEIAKNKFYSLSAVFYLALPQVNSAEEVSASLQKTARLTIQDSMGGGKIVQPNGGPAVTATLNTTLTVNGGTIENTSSDDLDDDHHTTPNCAVLLSGGGKAVINGGTLSGIRSVAVTGYITKEEEDLYKEYLGIEGYNNETYGNELSVTGGEISGTSGNALIVYEKAKKIELSGGTFSTQSNDHSIWVDDTEDGERTFKGDASSLLKNGYRYEYNGTECAYSENGNGVVGNTEVKQRPANEYAYIDKDGKLTTQANCTEITAATDDILTQGWYVLNKDITIASLNISGEVNLILCDGATLTVSSYMNVTQGSTLNLYWQSAGSGKLTAVQINTMGSVTAPAGEMKQTTDASGTTFEKCLTHEWRYTVNENDTHTATCTLCGKDGGTAAHEFSKLKATTETTHTFSCVCGAVSTGDHTSLSESPNADGLTHTGRCGICTYSTAPENHSFTLSGGMCTCFAYLTASYNGQSYASLASAVAAAAKNGGTVTLERYVTESITVIDGMNVTIDLNGKTWFTTHDDGNKPALTVDGGSVTVKNGTMQTGAMASACTPVVINGGSLTVGESVTVLGAEWDDNRYYHAIEVNGGELTLSVGTKLGYGMSVPAGKTLADYLPENAAFEKDGSVIDGHVQEKIGKFTLTVVEHTHTGVNWDTTSYKLLCACGKMVAQDTVMPQFEGIKYGTTYYGDVKFKVTHKYDFTVTDNGTIITPDEEGYYTVKADNKGHEIRATAVSGMNNFENIKVYKVYNVTLPTGECYTISGDATVGYGQEYTFTVKIAEGYSATNSYAVKVNGEAITGTKNDNTYTYTIDGDKVSDNLDITVEGIADITAPEAEIKIGTNSFHSFLNAVTFKLFFKNTQTVTVTATDAGSGVAKAEYLLSETPLTEESTKTGDWTEFDLTNGEGSFSIQPNNKGYVYVRVTDNSGNVTVVNSDGVVVYTDSDATTNSIEFTRLSTGNVTITIEPHGNTVKSISCDGKEINSEQYVVRYPNTTSQSTAVSIELENAFLSTLAAGEHIITVAYNPMGEAYVEGTGNIAPTASTVELTVVKKDRELDFFVTDVTYDGNAYDNLNITDRPDGTTVKYKKQDATDETYSTDAPKNAGSYTVQIIAPEDENYKAKTVTADFTIAKKEVTITGVTVGSKTYDGSNSATITNSGTLSENYDGENLTIVKGKATFDDANVGTDKDVTFTDFALGGSAAGNYELKAQPEPVKANINKADAKYTAPTGKTNLVYNGDAQALITAGDTADGTIKYSLDKNNWQDEVPTGKEAKTYTVWYKVTGDDNHNNIEPVKLDVTIQAKTVNATVTIDGDNFTYNGKAHTPKVTVKDGDTVIDPAEYDVSYSNNTNAGEATVTVTDKNGGNYTVSGSATFTIKPCDIKDARITLDGSLTYTGKAQTQKISSVKVGNLDVTYDVTDNARKDAGKYELTVTGTGNFIGTAKKDFTIAKAKIDVTDFEIEPKTYDGKTGAEVKSVSFEGLVNSETLTLGTDFAATAEFNDASAGTKTATMTVTPKNTNLTQNYVLVTATFSKSVEIAKADAQNVTDKVTGNVIYGEQSAQTASVADVNMPADAGTITYTKGRDSITNVSSWDVSNNGTVTYTISGANAGETITLPVVIGSTNYNDVTVNVVITVGKAQSTISITNAADLNREYDGKSLAAQYNKTGDGDVTVEYFDSEGASLGANAPTDAESYKVVVTQAEGNNYKGSKDEKMFTISPANVSLTDAKENTPEPNTVYVGTEVSAVTFKENKVTVEFNGKPRELEGTWRIKAKDDSGAEIIKFEKAGTYTCTATFTPDDPNFASITVDNFKITVVNRPAGGGALPVEDDVKTDTDKDTSQTTTSTTIKDTKTETVKDDNGNDISKITATVSDKVADKLVDQAVSNKADTVEITVKSDNGNKVDSEKQIELEIPKSAVKDIADKTDASLIINTDNGQVVLDNKTLETIVSETEGDTVKIAINENTQLKEAQKPAADVIDSGKLFDVAVYIGNKRIHDLNGGKVEIWLPIPEKLKDQDIAVVYINDKGICEILNHTVKTVGAENFAAITVSHFSNFAVVKSADAEKLIKQQNQDKAKDLIKEAKLAASTSKTSKKNVKVTIGVKIDKSLIKELKSMGYTVKYKYYRSTKKASKYTAVKTKTGNTYINTSGKKGTKYYYKAKVLVYDGKNLIAQTALKQCSYGVRTWSK